jgi:error-prone DNA polymerase
MPYVELHCHSNYSFKEGASHVDELLDRARELGYPALALTDHDNLCGAMPFARYAGSVGIQPITGVEVTLTGGSHLTLLAETREGYANLCRLLTCSYMEGERREPRLDPQHLAERSQGVILLTGCPRGETSRLLGEGRHAEAEAVLREYLDWFGSDNVFVELQRNLIKGEAARNRGLIQLSRKLGVGLVATNNVHYHVRERHRLQSALVAIKHNQSLDEAAPHLRTNSQYYLKSPRQMQGLFRQYPEAIANTLKIAGRCTFDLTRDLGYRFPDYPVPAGHTPQSYLEELCYRAAQRRYGGVNQRVRARLRQEFDLIRKHDLAGFLLMYHDIIQLAREVMIDLGLTDREIPLEERPPGRGRGSSVAMLVGYLIGLSHIDPLQFNLSLERFLPEDLASVPDIDLDFPRNIREELIKRVHREWGWDRAALTGMIATYQMKGAIRGLGKALGLPAQEVDQLAKRVDSHDARELALEMESLPEFRDRRDAPVWRDLIDLAHELDGFPQYLAQHPGGMVFSSQPLTGMVPVQPSAMEGRYICQWDKDAIDQAGFIKIDFLSLGTLSQMQEMLQLIEEREGEYLDLSRINFEDEAVYRDIHQADTIGIFQVESAAQRQTTPRIRPVNLTDMAYEVAAVRPGVGANDGVTQFIQRRNGEKWEYDHPLERRALERTLGVILFQDQVNQLATDVAGFSPAQADQLRRTFTSFNRRKSLEQLQGFWLRFRERAMRQGVPEETADRIFKKFNGHYMFPEAHAFAFGVTAYHMAWLKHYYPLEFFVAIFNQQPMGYYNLETLKEDARRHGVRVLNPDINHSLDRCVIKDECLLLGFLNVHAVGESGAAAIIEAREWDGPFAGLADAMQRTGLQREAVENLVKAGAFDSLIAGRRDALVEVGLHYRPRSSQLPLQLPVEQDRLLLPTQTPWEVMEEEYRTLGLYPQGHVMGMLREHLDRRVLTSQDVVDLPDGATVTVAGLVVRRQRPLGRAVYITLEDELGHTPLVVWPGVYLRLRLVLRESLLVVRGAVNRQDGTMNIVVQQARSLKGVANPPRAKNWS